MARRRHTEHTSNPNLFERCVLEIAGRPAGILVREGNGYIFFSVGRRFNRMDRERFKTIGKASRKLGTLALPSGANR